MSGTSNTLVLVTGGSGFVGAHCILAALRSGYSIRTTVRSLDRADAVRNMLQRGGAESTAIQRVHFVAADLHKDQGWDEACRDCDYVLHVASPFPNQPPKNEDDLIVPARDGTLRVLKAAKRAGTVKRVVITASTASIVYGHPKERLSQGPFTENDWTNLDHPASPVGAYQKSKTLAERAARDWFKDEGGALEFATVHPCGIYGPVLSKELATSASLVDMLMNGKIPMLPQLGFGVVDVRDVADLHILAMTRPEAKGERFLAVPDDYIDVPGVATILREKFGKEASKVPTRVAPIWLLKFVGMFDSQIGMMAPELGKKKVESNEKAKRVLGWQPRSVEEALVASVESMKELGLL